MLNFGFVSLPEPEPGVLHGVVHLSTDVTSADSTVSDDFNEKSQLYMLY